MSVVDTFDGAKDLIEYDIGSLQFSAYHFHHNREPYYVMFIKNGDLIYIELIHTHSHRNKYVYDVVMPFEVMESNANLKKYYDMSIMLVNTDKSIYYDTKGWNSKYLISTYDTDSDSNEEESEDEQEAGSSEVKKVKKEKVKRSIRHWCINCDTIWKNLRVSKQNILNCYYNIDPFTYEYKLNNEKYINSFISNFDSFAKYTSIPQEIVKEITTNYNDSLRLIRNE